MPSAPSVAGPGDAVDPSPREAWKRRTASRVIGPYTPSAEMPSARCSATVVDEGALVTVRGPAATPIPSARDVIGPTTPSTSSPWAAWKRRTAARVTRPELAVGRDPQRALDGGHAFALAAALQHRLSLGDADRHDDDPGQQRGRHLRAGHPGPVTRRGLCPSALRAFQ